MGDPGRTTGDEPRNDRRGQVLAAALQTFARFGYRKTSMEDVARAAAISRPGLYFLFSSKPDLFRAAVVQALDGDVTAAQHTLADTRRPLHDRLIEAFDLWTGRYIGPMTREVATLMDTNPELLGPVIADYPGRFAALVTEAVAAGPPAPAPDRAEKVTRTLLSTAAGIKQEVATREDFVARMTVAVDLLLTALTCTAGQTSSTPSAKGANRC
ncbi:TetR/AcrR family transcriptional regulator [Mangrovihabitans endophyticus]|uniref:TetR family transcriptional regulator n=1 Tax=Mangrovihabitans endophyticus TaxID=1751298 RepID=A0A8J3BSS5_9ACTN|nr:TetR/AcrR family transcriptional regulator [Mangrovihabitans endophyticus]GGK73909.1 TetR family transcriptional regulator [Mangrovihabitans endophyticus]